MKIAKLTANLSLISIVGLCFALIYYSFIFGVSSLYLVGLSNEVDRYTDFMFNGNNNDPQFVEKAKQYRATINHLGQELFELNSHDPDVLSLLGYVATSNYWDGEDAETSLARSSKLHRLAGLVRPIGYDTYAEEAFIKSYQGQKFSQVLKQLELAQHFGPFESSTARAGIELMFSHWSELNRLQRLQAIDYLTSHQHYGISNRELNDLVAKSAQKQKLCNVTRFVKLSLQTCR